MYLQPIRRGAWTLYAIAAKEGSQLASFLASDPSDSLAGNKAELLKRLEYIAHHGPPRNTEISHQIAEDIFQIEKGRIRVLYFYGRPRRTLVFTHGFVKKGMKTKKADIDRAIAALKAFRKEFDLETIIYLEE